MSRLTLKEYFRQTDVFERDSDNKKGLDNRTVQSYKRSINDFIDYCKENKISSRILDKNKADIVQGYVNHLIDDGKTANTIHCYTAPIMKALQLKPEEVDRPMRVSTTHVRSRNVDANAQGKREADKPQYARLVALQQAVGLRRSELAELTGSSLYVSWTTGDMYIHVLSGKGGKEQKQRILPQHTSTVINLFQGLDPSARVFTPEEMNNKIDLHKMRASVAREAYQYYADRLSSEPTYRQELLQSLEDYHKDMCGGVLREGFAKQLQACVNNPVYKLRGANKDVALANGKPITYDRLALLATNVYHLSHWRVSVGAKHYML